MVETLRGICGGIKGLKLLYLFGSYAEEKAIPMSDVDIAAVADNQEVFPEICKAVARVIGVSEGKISVLDLMKTSEVLKIKVLRYGIRVVGDYREVIRVLDTIPLDTIEVIDFEKEDFYKWLRDSNPVDESVIISIVRQVEVDIRYLKRALETRDFDSIVGDEDLRRAFERTLHTDIEGIIDLLRHITSSLNLGIAEIYKDYVEIANRSGIISRDNVEKIKEFVDLRHKLIYRYRSQNYEEMWEKAVVIVGLWKKILEEVRIYLKDKIDIYSKACRAEGMI